MYCGTLTKQKQNKGFRELQQSQVKVLDELFVLIKNNNSNNDDDDHCPHYDVRLKDDSDSSQLKGFLTLPLFTSTNVLMVLTV